MSVHFYQPATHWLQIIWKYIHNYSTVPQPQRNLQKLNWDFVGHRHSDLIDHLDTMANTTYQQVLCNVSQWFLHSWTKLQPSLLIIFLFGFASYCLLSNSKKLSTNGETVLLSTKLMQLNTTRATHQTPSSQGNTLLMHLEHPLQRNTMHLASV